MELDGLTHLRSGKVRELYAAGEDRLLLVATDRVSTYDCVHPTPIPDKGKVLTGLSDFWFARTRHIVENHLLSTATVDLPPEAQSHADALAGRTMLCRQAEVIPFECVARGYLAGSGKKEYDESGGVCGVALPGGLVEASELPEAIFTPATKAESGHDENVPFDVLVAGVGGEVAEQLRDLTLAVYRHGRDHALTRGIILADTKLEFGRLPDGRVILVDELLTSDSSRYWPTDDYAPGRAQTSFDKQFVRDHAASTGWDRTPPAPSLPDDVVRRTREKYVEAYERLTGRSFDDWLRQH